MPRKPDPEVQARIAREQEDLELQVAELVPADRPDDPEIDEMKEEAELLLEERAATLESLQEIRQQFAYKTSSNRKNPKGSREQVLWFMENLPRKKRKANGEATEEGDTTEEGIEIS